MPATVARKGILCRRARSGLEPGGGEVTMAIPATMKAVVLHAADDMRVEPRPVPRPEPGEVLLKVEVASICGTDV